MWGSVLFGGLKCKRDLPFWGRCQSWGKFWGKSLYQSSGIVTVEMGWRWDQGIQVALHHLVWDIFRAMWQTAERVLLCRYGCLVQQGLLCGLMNNWMCWVASFHPYVMGLGECSSLVWWVGLGELRSSSKLPYLLPRAPRHLEVFFMLLPKYCLHDGQVRLTKENGLFLFP